MSFRDYHLQKNLTRWNRAGLSHFEYIDGNAVTYLETLRQQLVEEFSLDGDLQWQALATRLPVLSEENLSQHRKRLLAQYYDARRDYAWEILRTYSRSLHVLGEYTQAYANEAYLQTATQWDNVRKLVGLIDYHPSPPASAETYVALLLKDNAVGEIESGFAMKNKPAPGEQTIVFETQEKVQGHYLLNCLDLKDANKNQQRFVRQGNLVRFPLGDIDEEINVGDVGVLAFEEKAVPIKVSAIEASHAQTNLQLKLLDPSVSIARFKYHSTVLHLKPNFLESPLAYGQHSAQLDQQVSLANNETVFISTPAKEWQARHIEALAVEHIKFSARNENLEKNSNLFKARSLKRQKHPKINNNQTIYVLPNDFEAEQAFFVNKNLNALNATITYKHIDKNGNMHDAGSLLESEFADKFNYIAGNYGKTIYFPDINGEVISTLKNTQGSYLRFPGELNLATGHWALIKRNNNSYATALINKIEQEEKWAQVFLQSNSDNISTFAADFSINIHPRDYAVNTTAAWNSQKSTETVTALVLDNRELEDFLQLGQRLICGSPTFSAAVTLQDMQYVHKQLIIYVSPAFHWQHDAATLTKNNCKIYANVSRATHGETQPEKILGSGDASKTNQRFTLANDEVSWIADAEFSAGVRADVQVMVESRTWKQVENFSSSAPEDHHYKTQLREDGFLDIHFGDGRQARKLSTGLDNARIRFRSGFGEAGNLAPFALQKVLRPHALVDDFIAPLAAVGGAQKESAASMASNGPATVLALERAVSIADYTHLAKRHSMVWQALAMQVMPDRPAASEVHVVIVQAGGAVFTANSEIAEILKTYLEKNGLPGTRVRVRSFEPVHLRLALDIMVDESAFDKKQTEQAVREHLQTQLALKQRALGQPLYRSEVIALIEQVQGVENAHCVIVHEHYMTVALARRPQIYIGDDGFVRRLSVNNSQVLYLDASPQSLQITTRNYQL